MTDVADVVDYAIGKHALLDAKDAADVFERRPAPYAQQSMAAVGCMADVIKEELGVRYSRIACEMIRWRIGAKRNERSGLTRSDIRDQRWPLMMAWVKRGLEVR